MHIRTALSTDLNSLQRVHEEAFGEQEGKVIAKLVGDMLEDETAKPLLSLVAEDDGKIVGSVLFSRVTVEDCEDLSVYILAPLAVATARQQSGLGTQLIERGLSKLKELGAEIVLVLGDPNYYTRTGFKAGHNIKAPYELEYPEAWMALELKTGSLARANGVARCADSLSAPEHW